MPILLLVTAVFCLGLWAHLFRLAGRTWRFELFSIDFGIGAFLSSCLLATLAGLFGPELSVLDRLAVAGLRSQAYVLVAGFCFNIGNALLLGTVSLLGLGRAFALVSSAACASVALPGLFQGGASARTSWFALSAGSALCASIVAVHRSVKSEEKTPPSKHHLMNRGSKALITGLIAGLFLGASYHLAAPGLWGELGLHSDAGLLLFAAGLLVSALPFGVYLMNVAIEGGRLRLKAYRAGTVRQHRMGMMAGTLWATGTFAAFLAKDVRDEGVQAGSVPFNTSTTLLLPTLLAIVSAWFFWRDERTMLSKSAGAFILVLCCLVVAAWLAFGSNY